METHRKSASLKPAGKRQEMETRGRMCPLRVSKQPYSTTPARPACGPPVHSPLLALLESPIRRERLPLLLEEHNNLIKRALELRQRLAQLVGVLDALEDGAAFLLGGVGVSWSGRGQGEGAEVQSAYMPHISSGKVARAPALCPRHSRLLSVGGYTPAGFNSEGPEPVFGVVVGGTMAASPGYLRVSMAVVGVCMLVVLECQGENFRRFGQVEKVGTAKTFASLDLSFLVSQMKLIPAARISSCPWLLVGS